MSDKEKYIYVKGKKIYVPDEVYRAYKKELNHESHLKRCLFLRKCTVVPEERIPLFRSKYTVRPEQDTACIILASASLLA